jgi:protein SCO1/2
MHLNYDRTFRLALWLPLVVTASLASLGAPRAAARVVEIGPRAGAGVDPKPGAQIPKDLELTAEDGRTQSTATLFATKPAFLVFVYYGCKNQCTLLLNGLVEGLKPLSARVGRDVDVVVVSIDPTEGPALAAAKRRTYMAAYGDPESLKGWHFLTGSAAAVQRLANAVGVRYAREDETGQYAHPAAVVSLAAGGVVSHYLYGTAFSPRDLRLAIVEASGGQAQRSVADGFLLLCFHYDEMTGRYAPAVKRALQVAGVGCLAALGLLVGRLARPARGVAS